MELTVWQKYVANALYLVVIILKNKVQLHSSLWSVAKFFERPSYKHHIFIPTAGARSSISPKICMVVEDVEMAMISFQSIILVRGMLIFGFWVKTVPAVCAAVILLVFSIIIFIFHVWILKCWLLFSLLCKMLS